MKADDLRRSDINLVTGGKLTGRLSTWEHILALPVFPQPLPTVRAAYPDYYDWAQCAWLADVSAWQGAISWSTLLSKVDGVIVRGGYGTTYDNQWLNNREPLRTARDHVRGVYWYYNTGATWEQQRDKILEALDYFQPGELEGVIVDIEKTYNAYWSPTFQQDPLKILRAVKAARPDLKVQQYWNKDVWENCLKANGDYLEFGVWYAWYPYFPDQVQYPSLPKGVSYEQIDLWQDRADQNLVGLEYGVQSKALDQSRSRDTRAEFFQTYKGTVVTPPPPPPPEEETGNWDIQWVENEDSVDIHVRRKS